MAGGKRYSKDGDSNGEGPSLKEWYNMIKENIQIMGRKRENT
jgi:hypothetical protein